ncbi:nucloid associated Lsr2-like [Mycobacterium phage DyoEdafos]|uniref:Lsr2-like DNA bridging protein n=1 Tax=Mycobacterium phage DyoEdafos TaxID=2599860 RepID=A0A5J6TI48_9CAUD|nr:nucloid associated Lsr2-like [Mycobacterium phage DyoEdafos]QFG10266.1 Lsr2-like DNA bridging protein [Mycobacterium phage DyoEdafos]
MGKRVTVTVFDDLDPDLEADTEKEFSVDGVAYRMDLSSKNAAEFDKDMSKWIEIAERVGKAGSARRRTARGTTASGGEPGLPLADIRKWAKGNGFPDVSTKGRVSAEIVRAWKAAGSPVGDEIDETPSKPEPKKAPAKKAPTVKKDEPAFSSAGPS